jgi:hypothetical protein
MLPPSGRRRSWTHYGVMMPGLPDPHRFFNVMAVAGTPGLRLFANDDLISTTPNDTAYVLSATSSMTGEQFRAYRIGTECDFAADGTAVRFGEELAIEADARLYRVRRAHPEVTVELELEPAQAVTHFVRLPGIYRHWSVLCTAQGRVGTTAVQGLATLEYAWGVGMHSIADRQLPNLPAQLFTYHVLNVDDDTQLLLTHVLGPRGVPLQRAVHVRTPTSARTFRRGHHFYVDAYEPRLRETPDGRRVRLPLRFSWGASGVGEIHGEADGDWVYGLGAGYAGSYDYRGTFRGRPIEGRAYAEYVDCRR